MGIDTERKDRIMAGQNHKAARGGALAAKPRFRRRHDNGAQELTIAGAMWSPNTRKLRLLLRKSEVLLLETTRDFALQGVTGRQIPNPKP